MKKNIIFVLLLICNICVAQKEVESTSEDINARKKSYRPTKKSVEYVPLAGNAFITTKDKNTTEEITENGLQNWSSKNSIISVYVKVNTIGKLSISLIGKVTESKNKSVIKCKVNGKVFVVKLKHLETSSYNGEVLYSIGDIDIKKLGYLKIDIQGISKTGENFGVISNIIIGNNASKNAQFANDNDNFYWSRRGPSCHLNYVLPTEDVEYFYSEITVPIGQDKIGSYFMANGFDGGYFGIQVNSAIERRVLFSIWEEENKPKTILVNKGINVKDGRFDGEGTGGQSFLLYNWNAGTTYKFLTKATPDGNGSTDFTSWFFATEKNEWKLMATWKKAETNTYIKNAYSFIENFEVENGYLGRKAFYHNQWAMLTNGEWQQVNKIKFTADATGRNKQRFDYKAGVEGDKFYLQNGAFTNTTTTIGKEFTIINKNTAPKIEIDKLPTE